MNDICRRDFSGAEEFVVALLDYLNSRGGSSYFDARLTQLEHGLQSACLAQEAGAPDALVAAALLHDVGHLLLDEHNGDPSFLDSDLCHEKVGALLLARWFEPAVVVPIVLHVSAKRYLVAVDPTYRSELSAATQKSLMAQGGPFSPKEADHFATLPYAQDALLVRRWDDRAKVAGKRLPPLREFAALLSRLAIINGQAAMAHQLSDPNRFLIYRFE
jgi:predicted HD phosphohydrolase